MISVLCCGQSSTGTLLAHSPCDPCFIARAYYGNINFFGGPSTTSVKASAKLKQLEEENEDAMFVIVSDVWLDSVEVMEKLHLMFSGLLLHHKVPESRPFQWTPWDRGVEKYEQ